MEISFWMISVYIWDKKALHQKQQCWSLLQLRVSEKMRCDGVVDLSSLVELHCVKLAPQNGWLEDDSFPFGAKKGQFSGAFAVSFREGLQKIHQNFKSSISIVFSWKKHMYMYIYIYITWPSNVNGMAGWLCCIGLGRLIKLTSSFSAKSAVSSGLLRNVWTLFEIRPEDCVAQLLWERVTDLCVCVCACCWGCCSWATSHTLVQAPKSGCF